MVSIQIVLNRQGLFIRERDDLQGMTKICEIMNNMEKLNREQKFSLSYNIGNKGPQMRVAWGKVQNNSKCVFFSFSSLALDFSATGCCEYQTST